MIPRIEVTPAAATVLSAALAGADASHGVHVFVDEQWHHGLDVGPRAPGELVVTAGDVTVLVPPALAECLDGVVIDYVNEDGATGFRIDNPNAPAEVTPMTVRELAARRRAGDDLVLLDVRTDHEVTLARIDGARRIDVDDLDEILALDRSTPLALICHHGIRSHAAARYLVQRGFRTVYNVVGGIDAWAVDVDPRVPRY